MITTSIDNRKNNNNFKLSDNEQNNPTEGVKKSKERYTYAYVHELHHWFTLV